MSREAHKVSRLFYFNSTTVIPVPPNCTCSSCSSQILGIQNQFQIDEIAGNAELINFLRNTFKNNELFIHAEIDKNAAEKQEIVYTSRQQFEKMSQQNKELLKLMEHYGFYLDN